MSQQAIGKILLIARGNYEATDTYNVLDWVRYNGRAWVCKNNGIIGVAPSESEYWALLAQDGSGGTGGRGRVLRGPPSTPHCCRCR